MSERPPIETRAAQAIIPEFVARPPRSSAATVLLATAFVLAVGGAATAAESTFKSVLERYDLQDREHPVAPGGVLFIGSSTIERWAFGGDIERDFPGVPIVDRGVSGTTYRFLLEHFNRLVPPYRPSRVVVYSGDNDVAERVPPERIAADAGRLFDEIHSKLPRVPIVFVSIKPSPDQERLGTLEHLARTNALLAELPRTRRYLTFVNIAPSMLDAEGHPRRELFVEGGLHMNREGYAIWAQALRPYVVARSQ